MLVRLYLILIYSLLNLQLLYGTDFGTKENLAHNLSQRGEICIKDSNWIEALDCYVKMIPLYKEDGGKNALLYAKTFSLAGNICQVEEQYIQALDFYILGLEASDIAGNGDLYDQCLGNIGNIYMLFKDYENALLYYNKGYERCVAKKNIERQAIFLTNIISTYCYMHQPAKAKKCFHQLIKLPVKDVEMQTFYNLINQALIAQTENNYSGAIFYHEKAMDYALHHILDERFMAAEYRELSNVYRMKGDLEQAIDCLKKAEEIAIRKRYTLQLTECYKLLAELYNLKSDAKLEGYYQNLYVSFSDSINQREYNKVKSKLIKYEEQQNNLYIGKLSGQINMQRWIIISVSICFFIVLLLVIFIIRQNRMLQRAYQILFNRDSELINSDNKYRKLHMKYLSVIEQLKQYLRNKNVEELDVQLDKKTTLVLSNERSEKLLEDILRVMDDEISIYNSDFNLNQLAKLVNSNSKYVSWIINDTYNKNFRTFLNEYRIREASKRLLNAEKYGGFTIQAIAEAVGYKSVTNFVVTFKKNVGITPSLYQKMARRECSEDEE